MMLSQGEGSQAYVFGIFEGAGQHLGQAAQNLLRLQGDYQSLLVKYEQLQLGMAALVALTSTAPDAGGVGGSVLALPGPAPATSTPSAEKVAPLPLLQQPQQQSSSQQPQSSAATSTVTAATVATTAASPATAVPGAGTGLASLRKFALGTGNVK